MTILGSLLALAFAAFLGWNLSRAKEPPAFAYIAFTAFAAIPVLLLLKSDLTSIAFSTPEGEWVLQVRELENRVTEVARISNIRAASDPAAVVTPPGEVLAKGTRVRILDVGPDDAFRGSRDEYVGQTGTVGEPFSKNDDEWWGGRIILEDGERFFYQVQVNPIDAG
jgi:hypothetical protein